MIFHYAYWSWSLVWLALWFAIPDCGSEELTKLNFANETADLLWEYWPRCRINISEFSTTLLRKCFEVFCWVTYWRMARVSLIDLAAQKFLINFFTVDMHHYPQQILNENGELQLPKQHYFLKCCSTMKTHYSGVNRSSFNNSNLLSVNLLLFLWITFSALI